MRTIYKRTHKDGTTRNHTQWGEGVRNTVEWGGEMCGSGCLHAYRSPELAVFLAPLHGVDDYAVLWEARTPKILADDGLKIGCASITTIKRIPLPTPTLEQRVEFAIRCGMLFCKEPEWLKWAKSWLDGTNRSAADAARAAARAADAAYAAANAAADAAYAAANAAADAARAAARAADAAYAAAKFSRNINRIAKQVMRNSLVGVAV